MVRDAFLIRQWTSYKITTVYLVIHSFTVLMDGCALSPPMSRALEAQAPGTPLIATRNPRNRSDPLPTLSLEGGAYRYSTGWFAPIALRSAIDFGGFGLAAG